MPSGFEFLDPTYDCTYPFRKLIFSSRRTIGLDELNVMSFESFHPEDVKWIIGSDPLVTRRQDSLRYNWPGLDVARDIISALLNYASQQKEEEDGILNEAFCSCRDVLDKAELANTYELASFLCALPNVSTVPSLDTDVLERMYDSIQDEIDRRSVSPDVSGVIDFLKTKDSYIPLEDVISACDIDKTDSESIRLDLDSNGCIVGIGGIYRYVGECDVRPLINSLHGADESISVTDSPNSDYARMDCPHIAWDYRVVHNLELTVDGCESDIFGMVKASEVIGYRNCRIEKILRNRLKSDCWKLTSAARNLLDTVHQVTTCSLDLAVQKGRSLGLTDETTLDILNKAPNIVEFNGFIKSTNLDVGKIVSVLKLASETHRTITTVQELFTSTSDWKQHGINTSLELKQLLIRCIPEVLIEATDNVDLSPLIDSSDSQKKNHVDRLPRTGTNLEDQIVQIVRGMSPISLFRIKSLLPRYSDEIITEHIQKMIGQGTLSMKPEGIVLGDVDSEASFCNQSKMTEHSNEFRLASIERFEEAMHRELSKSPGYYPQSSIQEKIEQIDNEELRSLIHRLVVDEADPKNVLNNIEESRIDEILQFLNECISEKDSELFERFDIPSNMFTLLFNRSREYYTAMSLTFNRGIESPQKLLRDILREGLLINRSESSDTPIDVRERLYAMLDAVESIDGPLVKDESKISALHLLLFLLNDYDVDHPSLEELSAKLLGKQESTSMVTEADIQGVPGCWSTSSGTMRYTSLENALSVNRLVSDIIGPFSYTIEKLVSTRRKDEVLTGYGIYSADDLRGFLGRFGLMKKVGNYLTNEGGIEDAVRRYVEKTENYDPQSACTKYIRKYGGDANTLLPIFDSTCDDVSRPKPDEESRKQALDSLMVVLEDYEWITKTNAMSLVEDKYGLKGAFDNKLMMNLGFKNEKDAYYKKKYSNFRECLKSNEFSGDDMYIDNTIRVKMECDAFKDAVDYFRSNLMWVPVSYVRYLNIRSDRYGYLYQAMKKYRTFVKDQCRDGFVTPHSLSRLKSGISDIDDDSFDLVFYESALMSTKVNVSSIRGQRFFHDSSTDGIACKITEFLKYIVNREGGKLTLTEIQYLLDDEYGIVVDIPMIRQSLKTSTCIMPGDLDIVYSSEEKYLEDIENAQQ